MTRPPPPSPVGGPCHLPAPLRRLVSGGQTGVDRAALDWALDRAIACGGWCPRGRWAEDGVLPARYPLHTTPTADPTWRTRRNVQESDATLAIVDDALAGGTLLAASHALAIGRPLLVVARRPEGIELGAVVEGGVRLRDEDAARAIVLVRSLEPPADVAEELAAWIARHLVTVLNVAGPRASEWAGGAAATRTLLDALASLAAGQG